MEESVELRPCRGPGELAALRRVWRSSVDATHDFVSRQDLDLIEESLEQGLAGLDLVVATAGGEPVGFAGLSGDTLEALFVAADHLGRGVGSALLAHVMRERPDLVLDVNADNLAARRFYEGRGFVETGRSPLDRDGRPYPLIHLRAPRA